MCDIAKKSILIWDSLPQTFVALFRIHYPIFQNIIQIFIFTEIQKKDKVSTTVHMYNLSKYGLNRNPQTEYDQYDSKVKNITIRDRNTVDKDYIFVEHGSIQCMAQKEVKIPMSTTDCKRWVSECLSVEATKLPVTV